MYAIRSYYAVSGITAELIEKKLLLEKQPGVSVGGRRPVLLTLNPDGAYTIGVFLSVRRINVVIINRITSYNVCYTKLLRGFGLSIRFPSLRKSSGNLSAIRSCPYAFFVQLKDRNNFV